MALFGSTAKKFIAALNEPSPDWKKLRSLSTGAREKGGSDRALLALLVQRACEADSLPFDDFGVILRNLTASGLDINFPVGSRGETALHQAVACEKAAVAEALILAGASPQACGPGGTTPIHLAAGSGSLALVELLAGAGADINAEDALGNTPLHYAVARHGNGKLIEFLIERGAAAWSRNREGVTPLRLTLQSGTSEYAAAIERAISANRIRRSSEWKCPSCGCAMPRPPSSRIQWQTDLGVWDHLLRTCGRCGRRTPTPVLEGER